ncbi:hypothetical protein FA95DRAFT_1554739 [Auriscalpium vulgare]|uniref:Uncharacterized protein n=1 Tax=Auriscalpium vulgare TaxID=40419 RepID=A0ACB8S4Z0_9AGAM|nr:hypothetical protein FA95DRAFT_1554739 [Auriscalpium vulgare]
MNPPRVTVEDVPDEETSLMAQLREAAATPTPLAEFLLDPEAIHSLTSARSSSREHRRQPSSRGASASTERGRSDKGKGKERRRSDAASSMLSIVLAEEERQAHHLKAMLRVTGERLENEVRRSDTAEQRATVAELRAREAGTRAGTAEQAQHAAEMDAARAREETKRFQMQLDTAEREMRRVQAELARLTRQKEDSDEAAAKARDMARKWQAALKDFQAREEGREEGMRMAMYKRYDDGREDGWEEGHSEGYDEGRKEGFNEGKRSGFEEGRQMGRREERKYAVHAYNRYQGDFARAYDNRTMSRESLVYPPRSTANDSQERIQHWAARTEESVRTPEIHKPRPVWLRRAVTAEPLVEGRGGADD